MQYDLRSHYSYEANIFYMLKRVRKLVFTVFSTCKATDVWAEKECVKSERW